MNQTAHAAIVTNQGRKWYDGNFSVRAAQFSRSRWQQLSLSQATSC